VKQFAAYAAYTRTAPFGEALTELVVQSERLRTAMMCSEAVWWRCHRRIVADVAVLLALVRDGRRIVDDGSGSCHGGGRPFSSRRFSTVEQTQHETSAHQECPDCHALTADLEAHKRWHSRLVHDIATAVDKDVKRRVGAQ
jgi:hypothetical protein